MSPTYHESGTYPPRGIRELILDPDTVISEAPTPPDIVVIMSSDMLGTRTAHIIPTARLANVVREPDTFGWASTTRHLPQLAFALMATPDDNGNLAYLITAGPALTDIEDGIRRAIGYDGRGLAQ